MISLSMVKWFYYCNEAASVCLTLKGLQNCSILANSGKWFSLLHGNGDVIF